jgi:hypothetical protein
MGKTAPVTSAVVAVLGLLVAPGAGGGCFSADVDGEVFVDCAQASECPTAHRCEQGLGRDGRGRCLPVDRSLPVALPVDVDTDEDTAVDVPLAGRDADGDVLRFRVVAIDDAFAVLDGAALAGEGDAAADAGDFVDGGVVRLSPRPDWFGTATFSFVAVDDDGLVSAPATATVRVRAVDDAPRFVAPALLSTDEEQRLQVNLDLFAAEAGDRDAETLQVIDVDSTDLVVTFAPPPSGAAIEQEADGDIGYTPPRDFAGDDTLQVTATVGGRSVTHTLSIAVLPVNDPPTIAVDPILTTEDTPADIPIAVADVDGDADVLVVDVVAPEGGVDGVVGAFSIVDGPALRFVPAPDYAGDATVTLRVRDPDGAATTLVVPVVVSPVPDVPQATPATLALVEDTPLPFTLGGVSVDGSDLDFVVTRPPRQGELVDFDDETGAGIYVPHANATGLDSFAFVVRDASGLTSAVGEVAVVIEAVDDPPTIQPSTFVLAEDADLASYALAIVDPEGDPFTLRIAQDPARGAATVVDTTTLAYVPDEDAHGVDEVIVVAEGSQPSTPVVIRFNVLAVPDAPRSTPAVVEGDEDDTIPVVMQGEDPDGAGPLTFTVLTLPAHGTLTVLDSRNGIAVYEPEPDFFGEDSFVFSASTTQQQGVPATVSLIVRPVNDPPTLQWSSPPVETVVGTAAVTPPLTVGDIDDDDASVRLVVVTQPARGTVTADGERLRMVLPRGATPFVGDLTAVVAAVDVAGEQSAPVEVVFRVVVDTSCSALRNSGVTDSGLRRVADGSAYCDMTTEGGGWTLVAKIVDEWAAADPLWETVATLNREEQSDPFPQVDAKFAAFGFHPTVGQILVETWDATPVPQGRQTMIVDLVVPQTLPNLFADKDPAEVDASVGDWLAAFAPGQAQVPGVACVQDGVNLTLLGGEACRFCLFAALNVEREGRCSDALQAYGIGVDDPFVVNAGADGVVTTRRRVALWVRQSDYSKSFPAARSCADHALAGRVLPGLYAVGSATEFCALSP